MEIALPHQAFVWFLQPAEQLQQLQFPQQCEPLRESCRLQSLRGWSHVKHFEEVFAGGS